MADIKNRFISFNPTVNTGHILTASSVIVASILAWAQLRNDVNYLIENDKSRKAEIANIEAKREADKAELWLKSTNWQGAVQDEIKELRRDITIGFNRLDDKLDRKQDKANVR